MNMILGVITMCELHDALLTVAAVWVSVLFHIIDIHII